MKECHEVINNYERPEIIPEVSGKRKNQKLRTIVNSMTNSQLKLIILEISAKSMINKLDETYLVRSCTNKLPIKRKLLYLKFNKNENPMDFFNTLEKQLDELDECWGKCKQ